MGVGSDALEGLRRLNAVLEAATVSYAAEWSGDELRIVPVADTREDLILLAEIEVATDVKLVIELGQVRTGCKIRINATGCRVREEIQQLD